MNTLILKRGAEIKTSAPIDQRQIAMTAAKTVRDELDVQFHEAHGNVKYAIRKELEAWNRVLETLRRALAHNQPATAGAHIEVALMTDDPQKWLRAFMKDEPIAAGDVQAAAQKAGFSADVIRRAYKKLGGNLWVRGYGINHCWQLPQDGQEILPTLPTLPTKNDPITTWLQMLMTEQSQNGRYAVYTKLILDEGAKLGFGERTIQRTYKRLGGMKPKKNGLLGWSWRLPTQSHLPISLSSSKTPEALTERI